MCLLTCLLIPGVLNNVCAQNSAIASSSDVAEDYSRLTQPEIAAAVKLTDEQNTLVQQLITERDTTKTAAEETARPEIVAASNKKLKARLKHDQQDGYHENRNGGEQDFIVPQIIFVKAQVACQSQGRTKLGNL